MISCSQPKRVTPTTSDWKIPSSPQLYKRNRPRKTIVAIARGKLCRCKHDEEETANH